MNVESKIQHNVIGPQSGARVPRCSQRLFASPVQLAHIHERERQASTSAGTPTVALSSWRTSTNVNDLRHSLRGSRFQDFMGYGVRELVEHRSNEGEDDDIRRRQGAEIAFGVDTQFSNDD